jgi:hypothetical protein
LNCDALIPGQDTIDPAAVFVRRVNEALVF